MVQYTVPHSLPTYEKTDPIAGSEINLRTNLNAMSLATNAAITAEGARIEGKRNRGWLPDGANLNSYNTVDQAGQYNASSTGNYSNAPVMNASGVFELVTGGGSNAAMVQRLTFGNVALWREAVNADTGSWSEWFQVETTVGSDSKLNSAKAYTDTQVTSDRARLTSNESKNAAQDATLTNYGGRIGSLETLGGLAPGDVSDATVNDLLLNSATSTAQTLDGKIPKTSNGALPVGKGELFKNVNDYANLTAARAASPIVASPGHYAAASLSTDNVFTSTDYTDAQGFMLQAGTRAAPVTDPAPVLWVEKVDASSRDVVTSRWDSGAGHFSVIKAGGTAPSAALSAFARNENTEASGIGGSIGIHGRAETYQTPPGIWGGWFYAASRNTSASASQVIGVEINLNSKAPDQGWMRAGGVGCSRMLVAVTQDNSNPISVGIDIGRGTNAASGHMHTGLLLRADSIVPGGANTSASVNNNEAIRIEGDSSIGVGSAGIRFRGGYKTVGISFTETGFANNAAILLADGQRIVVGAGPASSRYMAFDYTSSTVNLNSLSLSMNGTKVVGSRATGWGVASGTANKAGWNTSTVTLADLAGVVKALVDDLKTHGLIGA